MKATASDWSQFKLRVNIKCSLEKAYHAWCTPAGLESWFLRDATFKDAKGNIRAKDTPVQQDDTYEWRWHGYSDEVTERGIVLETNGKNTFAFTFSMKCPVTIKVYEEASETIVELIESNLPTDQKTIDNHYVGDSRGWIFYLTNLKSVLEGGLDLRNRKQELINVITA